MRSSHGRFLKAGNEVIIKADAGVNVSEEIALGGKSEFATALPGKSRSRSAFVKANGSYKELLLN
jgi:hypothetical protein